MTDGKYILVGRKIKPEMNLNKWAKWFMTADRHVGKEKRDGVTVSTVFLGLDHRYGDKGKPILFETMVFGGRLDQEQERYCTYEQAEAGHKKWVKEVFGD